MINFKEEVAKALDKEIEGISYEEVLGGVEVPPNYDMGDYAFPTFRLAKIMKKSPNIIAEELAAKISANDEFEKVINNGAYVNFYLNKKALVNTVINEVLEKKDRFGEANIGENKTVIVEFSSPNIAKPFHIGHIRTTVIGNALYKIFDFLGFNAVAINHLGDYGTQFGMLISAYKMWGNKEEIEADPINNFLKLYVKYNKEIEEHPEYKDLAREWFKKLEEKDPEAVELWNWIRELSLNEFNKVYGMLNIKFDSYAGEAFYSDKMPEVIDELEEKGLLVDSDGAKIIEFEDESLPPLIVIKSNGTTTYATRDIAAAKYRKSTYDFHKNLYVVASEQNLHFKQWINTIAQMGYEWSKDCKHINFGMVSLEEGSLSTREGRVLFLEDVLNKAIETTYNIIEERNPGLENKEEVAKQVGIGAILFQELFNQRIKDYVFSWDRTLSFEGETGPYVQYTYARISSLLDRGEFDINAEVNIDLLQKDEEVNILKSMYNYPRSIVDSMEKYEPFYVTRQLIEIAQAFNRFYNTCPVLVEDEELKKARLLLSYVTKMTIKSGLNLLGIEAPERM